MSIYGAINASYSGAGQWFNATDQRTALAGQESAPELAAIQAQDKKLAMQQVNGDIAYQIGQVLQENAVNQQKKNWDLKQRLHNAGAIFA